MLVYALLLSCSLERGNVKYVRDKEAINIKWNPIPTTISNLNKLTNPHTKVRSPAENYVYTIKGKLKLWKPESDGDLHIVVVDSLNKSIIVEVESPTCVKNKHMPNLNKIRTIVQHTPINSNVEVTGVLFFDFAHGQTGHADNYVELHPVICFKKIK